MIAQPDFFRKHMAICVGLGPVVYINHHTNELMKKFGGNKRIMSMVEKMCPEIFQSPFGSTPFLKQLQMISKVTDTTKMGPVKLVAEENPRTCHRHNLDNLLGHYPFGGSYKQMEHFRQVMLTGEFKAYDYDFYKRKDKPAVNNLEIYGQETPPFYKFENLANFPILLVGGKTDRLCKPGDYLHLHSILVKQNACVGVMETEFGHLGVLNPREPMPIRLEYNDGYIPSKEEEELLKKPRDHITQFIDIIKRYNKMEKVPT